MQTLKTAAIVVLLMTVMYGAYVSMTTPPEPLPSDVEDMLVMDDENSLAIDTGLPESLEAVQIDAGQVLPPESAVDASLAADASVAADASEFADAREFAEAEPSQDDLSAFPNDFGSASSTPVPAATPDQLVLEPAFDTSTGVTTRLTDSSLPANAMDIPVRNSADPAADISHDATSSSHPNYPSTNSTFELPDPATVVSDFDQPKPGTFNVPNPDLSLASGTAGSTEIPPSRSNLTSPPAGMNIGFSNAIRTADTQFADDKRKEALATLSIFYNTPNLTGEQRGELLSRLDPLAREVIYSTKHLLEQPYRVGHSETLMDVAVRYEVPWQLLANINQVKDPVTVLPGTELKVVRGPFRAEINLSAKELTLFLGDLYAGRFPVGIGNDPPPKPGTFTVQDKQTARTFYDASGTAVPPGSPNNPYGEYWLDLGGQLCIHGSPSTTSPTELGCISLAADYADDLYGILSQGSSVVIRR